MTLTLRGKLTLYAHYLRKMRDKVRRRRSFLTYTFRGGATIVTIPFHTNRTQLKLKAMLTLEKREKHPIEWLLKPHLEASIVAEELGISEGMVRSWRTYLLLTWSDTVYPLCYNCSWRSHICWPGNTEERFRCRVLRGYPELNHIKHMRLLDGTDPRPGWTHENQP